MSPKQQDVHLSKTFMDCNYLITVNRLSGMRQYSGCRIAQHRAAHLVLILTLLGVVIHCWVPNIDNLPAKFLVDFAVFICGVKTIADCSRFTCSKPGRLTGFLSYS